MPRIKVTSNVKEWARDVKRIQRRQIPFATTLMLTWTARDTAKQVNDDLDQYIDRPKPFTQKISDTTVPEAARDWVV